MSYEYYEREEEVIEVIHLPRPHAAPAPRSWRGAVWWVLCFAGLPLVGYIIATLVH